MFRATKSTFRISSELLDRQDSTDTPSHPLERTCLKNSVDVRIERSATDVLKELVRRKPILMIPPFKSVFKDILGGFEKLDAGFSALGDALDPKVPGDFGTRVVKFNNAIAEAFKTRIAQLKSTC
ncbi:hypothetical protein PM082_000287 [Marasmius tenuissimus]|nr:hypothetical protein PM082_000287 [Marasmius tenuissimus]